MNASIATIRTDAERALGERLRAPTSLSLQGDLAARRETAILAFEASGLPSRRVEAWKYTDLRALMKQAPALASRPGAAERDAAAALPAVLALADTARIDIVNGFPQASPLMPRGVTVLPLSEALKTRHVASDLLGTAFGVRTDTASNLNLVQMQDGLVILVSAQAQVETALHLAFSAVGDAPFAVFPRVLVVVEAGASLTLFESHVGSSGVAYQSNSVVEFLLRDGAAVDHVRLDCSGRDALSLSSLAVELGHKARFESFNLTVGPQVARHQIFTGGPGEQTMLGLRGATLLRGTQHGDVTLNAIHAAPHGTSRELFKTVVDDEATGVFQGKIIVDSVAQKTDGRMHSAALLLGENASMNNKPELEIFADDVQCAHGATVGALDDDLLFYAMARGIPRAQAEALLLESFIGEAAESIADEGAREAVMIQVRRWLAERAA